MSAPRRAWQRTRLWLGGAIGLALADCQNVPACFDDGGVVICAGLPRPTGSGVGTILTFTADGGAAVQQRSGAAVELNSAAFGGSADGGRFVVVGAAGTILTSADAVTWTPRVSPTPVNLYGVTYANGQFVAVGGVSGLGVILSGTADGVAWSRESVSDTLGLALTSVCFANGQLVAVGNNQILTSLDGTTWNAQPTAPTGVTAPTVDLSSTAYGNGRYVIVGNDNGSTAGQEIVYRGLIATSADAQSWSVEAAAANYLSGITYGADQFVAVGRDGLILTSRDGSAWTRQSAAPLLASATPYLISVLYAGGQFVVAGNDVGVNPSTGFVLTSPDAVTWSLQASGANVYGLAYGVVSGAGGDGGVGTYVVVGGQGAEAPPAGG